MLSRPTFPWYAILAGVIGLGAVSGCSDESGSADSTGAESPSAVAEDKAAGGKTDAGTASTVTLAVTADKTHAVQPNDEIRIEVTVEGFVLDAATIGGEASPGTGHYHVYLGDADSEPLLVSAEASAVVKVPAEVTDGTHTLRIQLRNNDHSPLDPPVEAGVRLIIYRL